MQQLTELDLSWNLIRDKGAKYLAEALEKNKVKYIFIQLIYIIMISSLSFRYSPNSTLEEIRSETKAQSISSTFYNIEGIEGL